MSMILKKEKNLCKPYDADCTVRTHRQPYERK